MTCVNVPCVCRCKQPLSTTAYCRAAVHSEPNGKKADILRKSGSAFWLRAALLGVHSCCCSGKVKQIQARQISAVFVPLGTGYMYRRLLSILRFCKALELGSFTIHSTARNESSVFIKSKLVYRQKLGVIDYTSTVLKRLLSKPWKKYLLNLGLSS